jgi:hypothetical protein
MFRVNLSVVLVLLLMNGVQSQPVTGQCVLQEDRKLIGGDAAQGDQAGSRVCISGDTAVVGASLHDLPGLTNAGAVYVYVRTGNQWIQQAKLTASDAAADDQFGGRVSIDGDTIVVSAYLDDNAGGSNAGAAYVFVRSGFAQWPPKNRDSERKVLLWKLKDQ